MKTKFKETQKFNQWWLWVVLIGAQLYVSYGLFRQLVLDESFGDSTMSNPDCLLLVAIVSALLILFLCMKLKTQIDDRGIKMSFFPFVRKKVRWEEVESVEVLDYGFVGGWGIRIGTKYGTVFNMRGSKGVAIKLKSGKKFLIGTQKESEIKESIKENYGLKSN